MTMTRILNSLLGNLCTAGLVILASCAPNGDGDPELTDEQVAALPDATDPGHAALADLLSSEVLEDDAATFDTDEAVELPDTAVDDDDGAAASFTLEPLATTLLKFGLHPRASDALRSIGITASRIMQTIGNAAASAGELHVKSVRATARRS